MTFEDSDSPNDSPRRAKALRTLARPSTWEVRCPPLHPEATATNSPRTLPVAGSRGRRTQHKSESISQLQPLPRPNSVMTTKEWSKSQQIYRLKNYFSGSSSDEETGYSGDDGAGEFKRFAQIYEERGVVFRQLEVRRQTVYQKKQEILKDELKVIEDAFEANEKLREYVNVQRTEGPKKVRLKKQTELWLQILCCIYPISNFIEKTVKKKALECVSLLALPLWRRLKMQRKERQRRANLVKERMTGTIPPTADKLSSIKFFAVWPRKVLEYLVNLLTPISYEKDEFIVVEGDYGDAMYLLHNGTVDVVVRSRDSKSKSRSRRNGKVVASLKDGSYFGEWALLTSEQRMASVICSEPTNCWKLTRAVFLEALGSINDLECKRAIIELGLQRRRDNMNALFRWKPEKLKQIPIFQNLSQEQLSAMVQKMMAHVTGVGDVIFQKGDLGDFVYFVEKGRLEVLGHSKDKQYTPTDPLTSLAYIGAGEMFGEIACLFLERRTATVRCISNCDMWKVRKGDFIDILMADAIQYVAAKRTTNEKRANWIPKVTLRQISQAALIKNRYSGERLKLIVQLIEENVKPSVFAASECIAEKGSKLSAMYWITNGTARSVGDNATLGPGSCIGGNWIFMYDCWPETFRTLERCDVWSITADQLESFLDRIPPSSHLSIRKQSSRRIRNRKLDEDDFQ